MSVNVLLNLLNEEGKPAIKPDCRAFYYVLCNTFSKFINGRFYNIYDVNKFL